MLKLTINNEAVEVEAGTTILEAASKLSYNIPTLCYQEKLSITGSCRICVVEVKGWRKLVPACATEVEEGMEVLTNSDTVKEVRESIFELIIANHPFDCQLNCLTCSRRASCELQKVAEEIGVEELEYEFIEKDWDTDTTSPSVMRENSKCIVCGRCVKSCEEIQHAGVLTLTNRGPATEVSTFMDKGMGNVDCTNCGQCIAACPTGAIHEVYHINGVVAALHDPDKHVVVQTAPAVRVALGEEFGMEAGSNVEGKMVTALRKIGFDGIFDTNFTADLTIMEEGFEFIDRLNNGGPLPLITSCSPGWIKFAEHNFGEDLDHLSSCKSPQQMFGALTKSFYPEKLEMDPEDVVSVSIMPCTAKKFESARPEMERNGYQDVDYVLTTRELAKLVKESSIDFLSLQDSDYDNPFGISTGAAVIFGATGGVMEAALRTAYEVITGDELGDVNFTMVRGLNGIKEAEVEVAGQQVKVAVASGLENAHELLQRKDEYHFIEIMACPGGCIGGGGQPISTDADVLEKRRQGLYTADEANEYRKSHENPAIEELYEKFLEEPLSEVSHELLHTHYKKRGA
jgi:NADH-quinone oxidoreductase subunit G